MKRHYMAIARPIAAPVEPGDHLIEVELCGHKHQSVNAARRCRPSASRCIAVWVVTDQEYRAQDV